MSKISLVLVLSLLPLSAVAPAQASIDIYLAPERPYDIVSTDVNAIADDQIYAAIEKEKERLAVLCAIDNITASLQSECSISEYIVEVEEGYANKYAESIYLSELVGEVSQKGAIPFITISTHITIANLVEGLYGVIEVSEDSPVYSNWEDGVPWNLDRISSPETTDNLFVPTSTGEGTYVYIIDSGVYQHNDFGDRVIDGFSVDDNSYGKDDCNGHGTHVASIAAGTNFGVAHSAKIVPVKVLGCYGTGSSSDVTAGLNWVYEHIQTHELPSVINLSMSGRANDTIHRILNKFIEADIAVVGSIGNAGKPACVNTLFSETPDAIVVGSSNSSNIFASSSSYGECLDIIAPGVNIQAALTGWANDTTTKSGTSMAAPHVTGVLSTLLTGLAREATYPVINRMLENSIPDIIGGVPTGTANRFLFSPSPEELAYFQEGLPRLSEDEEELGTDSPVELSVKREYIEGALGIVWEFSHREGEVFRQEVIIRYPDNTETNSEDIALLDNSVRSYTLPFLISGTDTVEIEIVAYDDLGNELVRSDLISLNPNDKEKVQPSLLSPGAGEVKGWTKRTSDSEIKFYAKYPQIGQKIQFMFQNNAGKYEELAWVRLSEEDLNDMGNYSSGKLVNDIYFVRTLALNPGKNRLRIMIDGELQGRTVTYMR